MSPDLKTLAHDVEEYLHWRKVNPQIKGGENYLKRLRESLDAQKQEALQPVECTITDDIVDAVINEHDMNVPDDLLAAPTGFGAHREAMRAALQKIIPITLHIEAEYKRAMKREIVELTEDEFTKIPVDFFTAESGSRVHRTIFRRLKEAGFEIRRRG